MSLPGAGILRLLCTASFIVRCFRLDFVSKIAFLTTLLHLRRRARACVGRAKPDFHPMNVHSSPLTPSSDAAVTRNFLSVIEMIQRKSFTLAAITVLLLCPLTPQLNAQVGVSNLEFSPLGNVFRSANQFLAAGFTTDSSATQFSLTGVSLPFASTAGTIDNFTVSIYTASGTNLPDTLVGTLAGPTSPPSSVTSTFTNSSLLLNANTTYWITWGFTSGTGFYESPQMNVTSASGDWALIDRPAISTNAGSSWSAGGVGFPMQFSVQASAVPEPAAAATLAGLIILGFTATRRRRRTA